MKVTQDQINSTAWDACDTFRGVVDPSEYKNYILVFLFIKYLSDKWKERKAELAEEYANDPERIERQLRYEPFQMTDDSTFDYLYENRNAANVGELINQALEQIQEANRGKLEGVFRDIDFNSERNLGETKDRNKRLKSLIEDFAKPEMDLRPGHLDGQDIIGNTYRNWQTIDKYSYVATRAEIEENDFNLIIPRYVDTFEEEEPVDIAAV